jgi:hypothetical protein
VRRDGTHVKPDPAPSAALVPVLRPNVTNIWDDVRLQKLWLGVEKRGWRSLAVLAANQSVETIQLAELLAQLAWRYRGQPSAVCDLRDLSMRLIDYQVREMRAQVESGVRLVVSLRSIFENPTSAAVAKETDGVLLCIALGETKMREAEETIAAVGREYLIGSVVLRARRPRAGQ